MVLMYAVVVAVEMMTSTMVPEAVRNGCNVHADLVEL